MSYLNIWIVVVAAGLLGVVGLFFLTGGMANRWLKSVLRWLPPVLLLVPAPVPGYAGHFAPAFVVVVFEGLFQSDGKPLTAGAILIATALLTLLLLFAWLLRSRRTADAIEDDADPVVTVNSGEITG